MKNQEIIALCKKGDRTAQRLLFDEYYNYVYTICFRYVQNHHDAEDVVSIIFNRIFKYLDQLQDFADNGIKKWIQTISINESLRFLKSKKPIQLSDDFSQFNLTSNEKEEIDQSEISRIKNAVNELPTGYRTIFLLNVVEGLTHAEIAKYLGISINTSKSQVLKAKKYLQIKLMPYATR